MAVTPGAFFSNFVPELDSLKQALPPEHVAPFVSSLTEMRKAMLTSDAWRSFFIIAIGCVLLFLYARKKLNATMTVAAIALLCLVDLWTVNKRYLYDEQFVPKSEHADTFAKTQADEQILQDTALNYRVLNWATNTFNEPNNNTSYRHKNVGGYHAAKLRRYQEMIDHHISKEMDTAYQAIAAAGGMMDSVDASGFRVLNMLNTKYFILPTGEKGQTVAVENPYASGNAWFVNSVQYVGSANEEIDALNEILPTETAVVDVSSEYTYKDPWKDTMVFTDSLATVRLTAYEPNRLTYHTSSTQDGLVVFSEIFYPGWQVTIDGQQDNIERVDYILRAVEVPAGEHTIEMWFDPTSLHTTETIAYVALALLLMGVLALIGTRWMKRKN
jgi:uncharacterized membrane protein YfhO